MGSVTFIAFFGAILAGMTVLVALYQLISEFSSTSATRTSKRESLQVTAWFVGIFGLITAACVTYLYYRWT